jgi:hypothetical protein
MEIDEAKLAPTWACVLVDNMALGSLAFLNTFFAERLSCKSHNFRSHHCGISIDSLALQISVLAQDDE